MARAYKELEAAGVVATKGRNGTVVCARDERADALSLAANSYASVAKPKVPALRKRSSCWQRPTTPTSRAPHGYSKKFSISISACLKP
ncbi:hypothetical protein AHiyo4_22930 [Arthrobacter sp. Hiyo4]|nr:hypothetical protein AHiyo4_22930 [Arthrobacter sp. Hiyo4]